MPFTNGGWFCVQEMNEWKQRLTTSRSGSSSRPISAKRPATSPPETTDKLASTTRSFGPAGPDFLFFYLI
jgi:hypothetical protein